MDTHAVSYTLPSCRDSSRTYQDLAKYHKSGHFLTLGQLDKMVETRKPRSPRPAIRPHIGVIGAGISGLRCADLLLQNGFQVTLLEARDRVGGRVHQTYVPNTSHLVDIGANWIHGTDENPILDLAKQTKTATHSWGDTFNVFTEDGEYMSPEEGAEYNEILWGIVMDAFRHSNEDFVSIPITESLYDFFVSKVVEVIPETGKNFETRRKTILQMSHMWGAFVGRTVKQQSMKFFWLEETIEGENLFCAGTYQKILALIAKPALENSVVKLSTTVKSIESTDGDSGKVIITTEKGESHRFDEVVVTTPLGWLKQNREAFTPALPPRFLSAVDSIGYGCLEKIYISFPHAFWISTTKIEASDEQINTDHSASKPEFFGFSQFLAPKYSSLNPENWIQDMVELGTLPGTCAHPTLLFYIFGDQSRALAKDLKRIPPSKERHELLINFFRPYFSRLPNYSDSNPHCIPTSSYATEWLNDDLAGNGSYSNFPTGLKDGDKDIEVMREGLPERGIWFAGEHTAPFVASGTVTGAYWSGEGVGKRIAEAYGMLKPSATKTVSNGTVISETPNGTNGEVNVHAFTDVTLEK